MVEYNTGTELYYQNHASHQYAKARSKYDGSPLADPELQFRGHMASAEHEPITGVWGRSPQRGPGAGQESPLKLKAF